MEMKDLILYNFASLFVISYFIVKRKNAKSHKNSISILYFIFILDLNIK